MPETNTTNSRHHENGRQATVPLLNSWQGRSYQGKEQTASAKQHSQRPINKPIRKVSTEVVSNEGRFDAAPFSVGRYFTRPP